MSLPHSDKPSHTPHNDPHCLNTCCLLYSTYMGEQCQISNTVTNSEHFCEHYDSLLSFTQTFPYSTDCSSRPILSRNGRHWALDVTLRFPGDVRAVIVRQDGRYTSPQPVRPHKIIGHLLRLLLHGPVRCRYGQQFTRYYQHQYVTLANDMDDHDSRHI